MTVAPGLVDPAVAREMAERLAQLFRAWPARLAVRTGTVTTLVADGACAVRDASPGGDSYLVDAGELGEEARVLVRRDGSVVAEGGLGLGFARVAVAGARLLAEELSDAGFSPPGRSPLRTALAEGRRLTVAGLALRLLAGAYLGGRTEGAASGYLVWEVGSWDVSLVRGRYYPVRLTVVDGAATLLDVGLIPERGAWRVVPRIAVGGDWRRMAAAACPRDRGLPEASADLPWWPSGEIGERRVLSPVPFVPSDGDERSAKPAKGPRRRRRPLPWPVRRDPAP